MSPMGMMKPALPDFDMDDWAARPEHERVPMMCRSWATQGGAESQPMGKPWMHWRIVDAADGQLDEGRILVTDLLAHQPWPVEDADAPAVGVRAPV